MTDRQLGRRRRFTPDEQIALHRDLALIGGLQERCHELEAELDEHRERRNNLMSDLYSRGISQPELGRALGWRQQTVQKLLKRREPSD